MDTLSLSALMFMTWGIFMANLVALFIIFRFRKNYAFSCDNASCQNLPDYLVAIFLILTSLSVGLIIFLNILISGWADMLILVISVMIIISYLSISFWKDCVARKNDEKITKEMEE